MLRAVQGLLQGGIPVALARGVAAPSLAALRAFSTRNAKALIIDEFGKPEDVLRLEQQHVREPGEGEVLINILAVGGSSSDLRDLLPKRAASVEQSSNHKSHCHALPASGSQLNLVRRRHHPPRPSGTFVSCLLSLSPGAGALEPVRHEHD